MLVAVVVAVCMPTARPAPAAATADAVSVRAHEQLSPRLSEYVLSSSALGREVTVRVQLPTGYEQDGTRWPLALLLHGRSEDGTTWSERTDLEQFDGMVVVTPEGGRVGWYTDWFDDSCCDRQRWETFHVDELLPWVERTFRIAPGRSQRFVAGDSMGGFGAMSYAARYPDLFAGAAELSGFVDLMLLESSGVIGVDGQTFQVAGVPPGSIFGPKESEEVRWRGANPVDLASNLARTDLVLRHGNGLPGRFGGNPDPGEAAIRLTGVSLHERLDALGIPHVWDDYGAGVHTWPYWEWGLQVTWPRWQAIAAAAAPDPAVFDYRSIDPEWSVYGWDVTFARDVLEFAEFREVSPSGFSLTGSGVATVRTPTAYTPGAGYRVTGLDPAGEATTVVADDDGRLSLLVDLGPSNVAQQFTPEADARQAAAGDAYFRTATVTIDRVSDGAARPAPTTPAEPTRADAAPSPSGAALPATGGGAGIAGAAVLLAVTRRRLTRSRRPVPTAFVVASIPRREVSEDDV